MPNKDVVENFGIPPEEPKRNIISLQASSSDVEADYQLARDNIKDLINDGKEAISQLLALAKSSQQPRAYEVLTALLNSVAGMNSELLTVSKKFKDIAGSNPDADTNVTNNTNLFITTAELHSMMFGKKTSLDSEVKTIEGKKDERD